MQIALSEKDLSKVIIAINELIDSLRWSMPSIWRQCGKVEPPARYKVTGFLAWADGSNWNPGAGGQGYYRWDGTTWVKVG